MRRSKTRKETTLSINSDLVRGRNYDRAEALFKKEQRLRDGEQAVAKYEAEGRATREKTARLKALRLARDAAVEPEAALAAKKRSA
jgi:hypothetical protein